MAEIDLEWFSQFETILFDCDGVILDSNSIKANAFYESVVHYGEKAASRLVEFHLVNGGISRYAKFDLFFNDILKKDHSTEEYTFVLNKFSDLVKAQMLKCASLEHLNELKNECSHQRWAVVSGSDQEELREVFAKRELANFFDLGIFGSPQTKDTILEELLDGDVSKGAVLYIGDSRYDKKVSKKFGVDFLFSTEWSDLSSDDPEMRGSSLISTVDSLAKSL